jgi:hypothetical protein
MIYYVSRKTVLKSISIENQRGIRLMNKPTKAIFIFVFILFANFLCVVNLFSEDERPSLAVLDVTSIKVEQSRSTVVYGYIIDKLQKRGVYTVVERKEIEKALKEIEFSQSGLVDNKTAARVGNFTGAKFVLISSLSFEDGIYYLSMRILETVSGNISATSMKNIDDFGKADRLVEESVNQLMAGVPAPKQNPFTAKAFFMSIGINTGMSIPLENANAFLSLAFEPALSFDMIFAMKWGSISLGLCGAFDYYGVMGQPTSYVMNFPLVVKADYILPIGDFYLFAGLKGGVAISNYKAATATEPTTGIIAYCAPEAGAGYTVVSWLGVSAGAGLDLIFMGDGAMEMNVTPFIKANIWF